MGLDMYLYKKTYVQNWEHTNKKDRYQINITKGGMPTSIKAERITYITETVKSWRKFNALHAWFVGNVQGDLDNCADYYIETEKLEELIKLLGKIENDNSLAPELLPTQSGFFFGDTDYDEYYFEQITNTKQILISLLVEDCDGDFYYSSSW